MRARQKWPDSDFFGRFVLELVVFFCRYICQSNLLRQDEAMFVEVDVEASSNCDYSLTRIFSAIGERVPVIRAEVPDRRGVVDLHEITGWSTSGPCQAYAIEVEDSGEGRALLLYGGDDGIRLKPVDVSEEWSLDSTEQWGEPCLLLDLDARIELA